MSTGSVGSSILASSHAETAIAPWDPEAHLPRAPSPGKLFHQDSSEEIRHISAFKSPTKEVQREWSPFATAIRSKNDCESSHIHRI